MQPPPGQTKRTTARKTRRAACDTCANGSEIAYRPHGVTLIRCALNSTVFQRDYKCADFERK